jgi:hypothetical protein
MRLERRRAVALQTVGSQIHESLQQSRQPRRSSSLYLQQASRSLRRCVKTAPEGVVSPVASRFRKIQSGSYSVGPLSMTPVNL